MGTLKPHIVREYVFYVVFKIKKTRFWRFLKWHVKKRSKRYQSFRMIMTLAYTVRSETTNNYIYTVFQKKTCDHVFDDKLK